MAALRQSISIYGWGSQGFVPPPPRDGMGRMKCPLPEEYGKWGGCYGKVRCCTVKWIAPGCCGAHGADGPHGITGP